MIYYPGSIVHGSLKILQAAHFLFFTVMLQLGPEFEIESKSKYVV